MTIRAWAIKAFKMIAWQAAFMPECSHKRMVIQFLLDAPNDIKLAAIREIEGK